MKKVIKKKIVKAKKSETIYKQLDVLAPEEIKYLVTTLNDTIDYAAGLVREQKEILKQLEQIKNNKATSIFFNPEETEKNIQMYTEALEVNIVKIKTMEGITNKLKAFEGIV